jgi:hypothetical protein
MYLSGAVLCYGHLQQLLGLGWAGDRRSEAQRNEWVRVYQRTWPCSISVTQRTNLCSETLATYPANAINKSKSHFYKATI